MKKPPEGWPRISSAVYYQEPAKMIDWLCKAFGFTVRLKIEGDDGDIVHSELMFSDDGMIFVAGSKPKDRSDRAFCGSPAELGGKNTQNMMVFVDDVDAHCRHARDAGAKILVEPKISDYGEEYWTDRSYETEDLEGHHWWFCQRLREQVKKK